MQKKRYANATNPTIEAVINGLFRFETLEQAEKIRARIRKDFILSTAWQPDVPNATALWIRGYEVTPEEEKKGYLGHFALVRSCKHESGKFTVACAKIPVELKQHPQKKRVKQRHPDWGHPILRAVKRGKEYGSLVEAQAELLRLHEEFPEVSIPGVNKLQVLIYQKTESGSPIKKLSLFIHQQDSGSCLIRNLDVKPKQKTEKPPLPTPKPTEPPDGYFTTLLTKQRARKKK